MGVTINWELEFDKHVSMICSKTSRKLTVLARMSRLLTFENRKTIFKAFVKSQLKYCPLIWMFHNWYMNNKINRLHERALKIVYDNYETSFENYLWKITLSTFIIIIFTNVWILDLGHWHPNWDGIYTPLL